MNLESKIKNYRMTDSAMQLIQETPLLLIASIVGGGKNTVVNELLKSNDFHRIISHTTRPPRVNHGVMEQNGRDYFFIDLKTAEQMVTDQAFIETKFVHGNVYGTSVAELQAAHEEHKVAVTDLDIQGVVEYLDVKPDTHAVFLLPPSVDTWIKRLESRYGNLDEHQEEISKRFRTAYAEIQHIQADERFVLIINDDLPTTVERVRGVMNGTVARTSEYALAVTEHLQDFLKTKL
jgi:guanylate kinase